MPHDGLMRRVVLWFLVPVLGLSLVTRAEARSAPIGQDRISPGETYAGDFPDPAVLRVGLHYYAYSTTSGGLNVPTLTSTDLRTWRANTGTPTNPTGDGLPRTPVWSDGVERSDGRFKATTWAPTVTRLGPGRFVMAYATKVAGSSGQRMCISVATATVPTGPFLDTTTKPTICPARGAIDPQIWLAPSGRPWLYWKLDHHPAALMATGMNLDGITITAGERPRYLAGIRQPWEGNIIENPAMIRFKGRYYLFYSANSYATSRYAIGYLICRTWYSRCTRPRKTPLMASGKYLAGPGGPMPFVDALGRLRVAYHAWRVGAVGYPSSDACRELPSGCAQRRLYVGTLRAAPDGRLSVVRWNG
jgi:hypothetical protein